MGDEDFKTEELTSGESLLVTSSVIKGRERKSVRGKIREEKKMCKGQAEPPFIWSILRQKLPHPCHGTIDPFTRALTS